MPTYKTIHEAATHGDLVNVQWYVQNGADVNAKDKDGGTPLMWAALEGYKDVVKFLLDNGADVDAKDNDGWTLLMWAAIKGHFADVELFVGKGADVNASNKDGWTPLMQAACNGHQDVVEFLVGKGADVNARNKDGGTPLMWAEEKFHLDMVAFEGGRKLVLVEGKCHKDVVKFLVSAGADVNGMKEFARTPTIDSATALITNAFCAYPDNPNLSAEAQYVLQTLRMPNTELPELKRLLGTEKKFGADYRQQHNEEMVDLLLYFIRYCLDDHKMTVLEKYALDELRSLLDIQDGDLYLKRRDEVRRLLEIQIDWIEADYQIAYTEELYVVDLQRIFDLSYDQMLELAQPHVAEILNNLYLQLSVADRQDIRGQIEQLKCVFFMLHYQPPFESKKEHIDEVAARMIPQSVKDSVWRRDEGKCVVCGSQANLEFDHIVPFSRGGSNTARNVQLLCQGCNRTKAAHIG